MNHEERISFLLRAAARAEGDGNARIAGVLRRMADDARPFGGAVGGLDGSSALAAT